MDPYLAWFDLAGIAVFAASGALTAARQQMDLVGFALIATVTGIGGGTLRDLMLGIAPVFWVERPLPLLVCAGVAVAVYYTAHLVEWRYRLLLWADAAGLAVFAVVGAERALENGAPIAVALVMGVMTGTFGGLVRDVICNEVPLILRREIYVTAALAGAAVFIAGSEAGWCGNSPSRSASPPASRCAASPWPSAGPCPSTAPARGGTTRRTGRPAGARADSHHSGSYPVAVK